MILEEKNINNRKYRVCDRERARSEIKEQYILDPQFNILGEKALKNNIKVKEVVLPSVQIISKEAFCSCSALRKSSTPKVVIIKEWAFANCSNLRETDFPPCLKEMRMGAFYKCKRIKEVDLGSNLSIKEIPKMTFAECRQLERLVLPVPLKEIHEMAFYKCESLRKVQLPKQLKSIGEKAFYQCGLETLILPEVLEEIGSSAFLKCKKLEYIKIPDSVKRIGKWAFHGCSKLKVLEIGHDPEEIGEWITNKNCIIRCPKGSRMEQYAKEHGMEIEVFPEKTNQRIKKEDKLSKEERKYGRYGEMRQNKRIQLGVGIFLAFFFLGMAQWASGSMGAGMVYAAETATETTDTETTVKDETENPEVTGITELEGQMYDVYGTGKSDYVKAEITTDVVSMRTMDNKTQTWRVIWLTFGPDSITLSQRPQIRLRMKIKTKDDSVPVCDQVLVGNAYYLTGNDLRSAADNYDSTTMTWSPKYGNIDLMDGSTTQTLYNSYYCIYNHNGSEIRYVIKMVRQGKAGLAKSLTYSASNPAPVQWVYDEETGRYATTIAEVVDKAVKANTVQTVNENGSLSSNLQWECILSKDDSQDIYMDDECIYVKKAGQYNIYKASYVGQDYYIPVRFTYTYPEEAQRKLEALQTDGIISMSDYDNASSFASAFTKAYKEKAANYFQLVSSLQKTWEDTEYEGKFPGEWDYVLYNKGWSDTCESVKLDQAQEMYEEIWENIFGRKEAEETITKYTDTEKIPEESRETVLNIREKYIELLKENYENGKILEIGDVEEILSAMKKEMSPYVKEEAEQKPQSGQLFKVSGTSFTRTEGDKAFSLGVKAGTNAVLTYQTSDQKVVTVTKKGYVSIKGPGRAVITVTAKAEGTSTQSKKITVTVKPSSKLVPKASAKKGKKVQIQWKRNAKASGYQIQVSLDRKFKKGIKKSTIKKNRIVKTVCKGLKTGRKYYVRVRSFKKVSGGTVYGNWVSAKPVKAKK